MEIIFEFITQIIFELVLQIFGEVLVEIGLRSLVEPFRQREEHNSKGVLVGYTLLGFIVGGLSLLIFPQSFVRSQTMHGISLLITPLLAGAAMSGMGWLRLRQGKKLLLIDTFSYGFIFAFAMALVRFAFTT